LLINQQNTVQRELNVEGFTTSQFTYERYVNLQYAGSDTMIMILEPEHGYHAAAIVKGHEREFSFTMDRNFLIENLRVRGRANATSHVFKKQTIRKEMSILTTRTVSDCQNKSLQVYFEDGWTSAPLFLLKDCTPRDIIEGPAMIYDQTQMIVVQLAATARILQSHIVINLSVKTVSKPRH
jgi:5-oxoprolinase (ATP-hydrolysing)